MNQYIDFGNYNVIVVGMTQSGKTTAVTRSIERVRQGVLFFNTQQIEFSNKYVDVTGSDNVQDIVKALRKGEKLNFIPIRERRWKQLVALIRCLYEATEKQLMDIYIVVDEIHLADKEALKACIELATTGIRWGFKCIFISQRPALIDNTIMNQGTKFIFFKTTLEKQYLDAYGIPSDEIKRRLIEGGRYSYMVYDFDKLEGAYKV